jgi:hypothetical protein
MAERKRIGSGSIIPAQALDAVDTMRQQLMGSGGGAVAPAANGSAQAPIAPADSSTPAQPASSAKPPATETLARRTGALVDEIDFPKFVASLVHGTFDAVVDASIRQMESYSSLVAAVAKTVDQFTEENVTPNQARDWLAQRFPGDIKLVLPTADSPEPHLEPRTDGLTPAWLADYGLDGEELTADLLEQTLLPQVRSKIGAERQQLLATMVLLGMNRVVVRDGTISAKVMFRASADDVAQVGYASNADPQSTGTWGERGSLSYAGATTKVSTLSVNAQSDTSLSAQLYGEVKLNFASETLPLEKMADAAKVALVQRNSPVARSAAGGATPAPQPAPATTPAHGAA